MTTKPLLLAVMLALPITANAEYTYNYVNTPARVPSNGTVTQAFHGPYQTITPGADDDKHIASTKYVIGAYNDAIAAINFLNDNKQWLLFNSGSGVHMESEVFEAESFVPYVADDAEGPDDPEQNFVSMAAVKAGILSQRVEVYTNWDDDDATTDVAFKTVVPE